MWRIWAAFVSFVIAFAIIITRLFYWQVLASESLRTAASSQHHVELLLPAARGSIYALDRSPLVINQPAFLVYTQPKIIKDVKLFTQQVSQVLGIEKDTLAEQVQEPDKVWVPLVHKAEIGVVDKLKELHLEGLGFEKEPKRYYPEASIAAYISGFVGSDVNGNDRGYFGLEGYYNQELTGKSGVIRQEKDAKGAPILIGEAMRIEPENGRDLVAWVDRAVQEIVDRRLMEGIRKYGAKEGSIVVMDPKTGGIMAMANYPSYDPAHYNMYDKSIYKNPIVAASYEPGSTFKVLVMSAALQEKLVTPTTTMDESGPVEVGEYAIRTWNNEYHGTITMTQVLEHSSNVGMVYVARKLGIETFLRYLTLFGFGESTGIDMEEETSPDLRPAKEWKDIDLATASFGQGIALTPIQMVRAVGSLANGGWMMEPRVVKEIIGAKSKTITLPPKKIRQVVSEATARIITEMMVSAVDQGEAKWAKPKGYRIAGKTGTAQIPVAGHYDEKKTITSFVGFAPADNPRFVMLVTLREPSSSPWGSETAAPLFFTIARDLFTYWAISPDSQ
ncbi:penicillin-binding protein 2 [Patescibacteria group bacterium]|nr:penicillin-binding protein 2 [Patescibacteria group bacterium]MBU1473203.1 penicillin-binding protein 2 [Patescibacteria group bacterium]MBU2459747.1 penicillin-binding protein 2 [Patescibacteria group bacterium]MBU2544744.1 penicillin-binding protein 2 [Patescibacteria group bacterium]